MLPNALFHSTRSNPTTVLGSPGTVAAHTHCPNRVSLGIHVPRLPVYARASTTETPFRGFGNFYISGTILGNSGFRKRMARTLAGLSGEDVGLDELEVFVELLLVRDVDLA